MLQAEDLRDTVFEAPAGGGNVSTPSVIMGTATAGEPSSGRLTPRTEEGNGIRFTAILRKPQFSWPGNRKQQVTPLMAALTRWFKSPYVGVVSLRVRKQICVY